MKTTFIFNTVLALTLLAAAPLAPAGFYVEIRDGGRLHYILPEPDGRWFEVVHWVDAGQCRFRVDIFTGGRWMPYYSGALSHLQIRPEDYWTPLLQCNLVTLKLAASSLEKREPLRVFLPEVRQ